MPQTWGVQLIHLLALAMAFIPQARRIMELVARMSFLLDRLNYPADFLAENRSLSATDSGKSTSSSASPSSSQYSSTGTGLSSLYVLSITLFHAPMLLTSTKSSSTNVAGYPSAAPGSAQYSSSSIDNGIGNPLVPSNGSASLRYSSDASAEPTGHLPQMQSRLIRLQPVQAVVRSL